MVIGHPAHHLGRPTQADTQQLAYIGRHPPRSEGRSQPTGSTNVRVMSGMRLWPWLLDLA